jgi:hypothetical protein
VFVYMRVFVYVCVFIFYMRVFVYVCVLICVCLCMCVCCLHTAHCSLVVVLVGHLQGPCCYTASDVPKMCHSDVI